VVAVRRHGHIVAEVPVSTVAHVPVYIFTAPVTA
jgi:hypothetical protein